MKSILFALLMIATSPALPGIPKSAVQVNEYTGQCGPREVVIRVYTTPEGKDQGRYSYNGKEFAVFIPPIAFAVRADGQVTMFNPAETGEEVCTTLEKSLGKTI